MVFMGHAEIHDRQHHEDKGLQGDNQNMEYRPSHLQQPGRRHPGDTGTEQRSNQDKDHLSGIHVAEQTQAQGEGLGQEADHFHKKIDRDE